ncbi:hypothetical protein PR003_g29763 [Phytophthora rubi]|uniref:Uncharacterized protein n=1 Tax=Phytophthora rubi TaxID=129364 RepID=A0A6A4BGU7_9STRA|nr:hypothetical protein PR002_g29480 [Phytophthora rubi]KAE9273914.1 hypothetical protein PR003_g29763 [Phytophthora rubi]
MLLAATWASCFHWAITLSATRILLCDLLTRGVLNATEVNTLRTT